MGKSNPAHRAGPPTGRGRWVAPARWVSASATAAGPPTTQGQWKVPLIGGWEPLHGGQGSISLEYQTCTSPYPFDTLVTGMPPPILPCCCCIRRNSPVQAGAEGETLLQAARCCCTPPAAAGSGFCTGLRSLLRRGGRGTTRWLQRRRPPAKTAPTLGTHMLDAPLQPSRVRRRNFSL